MSQNYQSDSRPLIKRFIFTPEVNLQEQTFVLRTSNFLRATISADSSSTETLYCLLMRVLLVINGLVTFFLFPEVLMNNS